MFVLKDKNGQFVEHSLTENILKVLKWTIGHEIELKYLDKNNLLLILIRTSAGFWISKMLLWWDVIIVISHAFPMRFRGKHMGEIT